MATRGNTRARALLVVLAMVLAACGGGDGDEAATATDGQGAGDITTTTADGGDTDGEASDSTDDTSPDGAADGSDEGSTDTTNATTAGGAAPATTAPAPSGGGGNGAGTAPAALDDAGALARVLRVADLPSGYQKNEETAGESEEQQQFGDAFERCMSTAGIDASTLAEPTGQAGRSFTDGPSSAQEPPDISGGVIGLPDTAAAQRMIAAFDALFSSEPGRDCVAEEIEKALEPQVQAIAPGAEVEVRAEALSTYSPAGAHAQLRLVSTITVGVQEIVYVTDVVVVQAGNAVATVSFTSQTDPFDPAIGRPVVDAALRRLAG